jgi:hypothetical protein
MVSGLLKGFAFMCALNTQSPDLQSARSFISSVTGLPEEVMSFELQNPDDMARSEHLVSFREEDKIVTIATMRLWNDDGSIDDVYMHEGGLVRLPKHRIETPTDAEKILTWLLRSASYEGTAEIVRWEPETDSHGPYVRLEFDHVVNGVASDQTRRMLASIHFDLQKGLFIGFNRYPKYRPTNPVRISESEARRMALSLAATKGQGALADDPYYPFRLREVYPSMYRTKQLRENERFPDRMSAIGSERPRLAYAGAFYEIALPPDILGFNISIEVMIDAETGEFHIAKREGYRGGLGAPAAAPVRRVLAPLAWDLGDGEIRADLGKASAKVIHADVHGITAPQPGGKFHEVTLQRGRLLIPARFYPECGLLQMADRTNPRLGRPNPSLLNALNRLAAQEAANAAKIARA